jgi:hypothetical protein
VLVPDADDQADQMFEGVGADVLAAILEIDANRIVVGQRKLGER